MVGTAGAVAGALFTRGLVVGAPIKALAAVVLAGRSRNVGVAASTRLGSMGARDGVACESPRRTTSEPITVIPMITAATVSALRFRRFASGGAGGAIVGDGAPACELPLALGSVANRSRT